MKKISAYYFNAIKTQCNKVKHIVVNILEKPWQK